jgi:hypothetical protein
MFPVLELTAASSKASTFYKISFAKAGFKFMLGKLGLIYNSQGVMAHLTHWNRMIRCLAVPLPGTERRNYVQMRKLKEHRI